MLVKEIMVKKVITIGKKDDVLHAFSIMMKRGIRHLPVMEGKKIVGIITDRDIRQSLFPWKGVNFDKDLLINTHNTAVDEIMTHTVHCINPETSIEEAAHIMNMHKIGGIPVINKRKNLIGIFTKSDIIQIFIGMMELLQKSSRIDVEIRDEPKAVKAVEKIVTKNGGEIISVGNAPAKGKNRHIHFFRIRRCDTDPIVSAIKKSGYKIVAVA